MSFCDNYRDGRCTEAVGRVRRYTIDPPASKRDSWYDLGYFMYFHSRETPGIRIDLNHTLNNDDLEILRESLVCRYRFGSGEKAISGRLEGVRIDPDGGGFWCFDYLGSMIVNYHKKQKAERNIPDPSFFPVELEFSFSSRIPWVNGKKSAEITVTW